ncbi:HAD-IA family hydrolase [Radiobacillus deserti]|uniref:HAD-IA family hydrolase n=1 Tax=Radiobacillus deserti TaxID=2594883 RepID=A0A516KFG2_9BACI|nr:HAD-IA family hydrolase [Radiobacillus deserti]QDP40120.1 HAD-IA family hydrolase [Radiobacillus deserti]
MYKHIIWDFDGTLFDTYPVMAKTFKELLEERGIDEPIVDIVKQMKVSMSSAINYYEKKYQIDEDFVNTYKSQRKGVELELSKPFEGIEEICKYIHTTNRRNYLYTHRGESSIELLKMYGLYDYFSDFITSQNDFERKPSPEAIRYLMQKFKMDEAEALMIGDRDLDLLAGKNAGISACYFTTDNEENEIADYIIHEFGQLRSVI